MGNQNPQLHNLIPRQDHTPFFKFLIPFERNSPYNSRHLKEAIFPIIYYIIQRQNNFNNHLINNLITHRADIAISRITPNPDEIIQFTDKISNAIEKSNYHTSN